MEEKQEKAFTIISDQVTADIKMNAYTQGVPEKELKRRIEKLQSVLESVEADGALILQKTDFFYFSGTAQQGWLYIPAQGEPLLMVFKDYERARAESALALVISIGSPKEIPGVLKERGYALPKSLGLELDVLPTNLYFMYQTIFTGAQIKDVSQEIRIIRAVKSEYEIEILKNAALLADAVSAKVPEILVPGMTELSAAGELESYARSMGHQGIIRMRYWGSEVFYGHLMSGPSAAVPSYLMSPTGGKGGSPAIGQGAGFNVIGKSEPVLVDYAFALNGYLADHARIFSIGPLPDELLRAHDAMLNIQEKAKIAAVPGTPSGDIYELMIKMARAFGYEDVFMGVGDRRIRFSGHGVGLELDEFPFIAKGQTLPLEIDMVLALEPKVIFPGIGVVGIENTFRVTPNGLESLTRYQEGIVVI